MGLIGESKGAERRIHCGGGMDKKDCEELEETWGSPDTQIIPVRLEWKRTCELLGGRFRVGRFDKCAARQENSLVG